MDTVVGHQGYGTLFLLASSLALAAGSPLDTHAQIVRGRLLDAEGRGGISGAMITLLDRQGNEVRRTLSRSSGLYQLIAPAPGAYRLRADRIGYAATLSQHFDVPPLRAVHVDIFASIEAISLAGIDATGDPRCRVRPAEGLAVARVWEEARKALAAAAWTQERGYYWYEMMDIERTLHRDGRKVVSEERSLNRSFLLAPYISRPADSLTSEGFANIAPDTSVYWAPDAEVLLSDPFLDTHCFRLRTDVYHAPGLIGLAFEPVSWRSVPDIGGTFWLDPATAQLERLDFTYRHLDLPETVLPSGIGGTVEFEAMPNGTWIVRSWRIRMPLARLATSPLTGREVAVLDGIEVEGGDVIRAHENDGAVALLESGPRGRIVGSVLDTLNAGLPGARVFIVGTGIESRTDREGKFELGRLDPGAYAVNFSHPYLQSLGYVPEPDEVEVMADAEPPPEVHFATPTVRWIVEQVCRDEERPEPLRVGSAKFPMDGFLIGQVTDHAGNPVPGETVRILWTRYGLGETEDQTRVEARHAFSMPKTNAAGNYIACWVPLDTRLEIAVVETGEGASLEDLDANELRTRQYTIVIPVSAGLERLDLRLGADPKPVRHARTGRGLVWRPYARAHGSTRG